MELEQCMADREALKHDLEVWIGKFDDMAEQKAKVQDELNELKTTNKNLSSQLNAVTLEEKELDALYTKLQIENADLKKQLEALQSTTVSNMSWKNILALIIKKLQGE